MLNLRIALRSLLKTPMVTAVAILSLALGIGANAAIFSIFESLILRPLPVADPDRLVNLVSPGEKTGSKSSTNAGGPEAVFSYPMFRDLEAADSEFSGIAAHCLFGANLAYQGNTISSAGLLVSGSYFEVLGLRPALGRLFDESDDRTPGAHSSVVLDHAYWRDQFGADPAVVGETLVVNGQPMQIVGVAPEGFRGTTLGTQPRVYVPVTMRARMLPGWDGFDNRKDYWMYLFARLKPGVSLEKAAAVINVTYRGILNEVELDLQGTQNERYIEQFKNRAILLEPGRRGQSEMHGEIATPLLLLLGVTGLVLLIACANLANLLLIKATNRANEIAVRLSIGAQRRQVVGQLLVESFVLAAAGSAAGFAVAFSTLRFFAVWFGGDSGIRFELGPQVWVFVAVLAIVTGLVGLFPAHHATREDLVLSLRNQTGRISDSPTASRFRSVMATFQIALSMTLLIAAGLFVRSLVNVSRVDLGIAVDNIAVFGLSPDRNGYSFDESRRFFERVEDEVAALPGVIRVAASLVPLLADSNWRSNVSVQGFEVGPDTDDGANFNKIGPGFLRALGIALLAGREFTLGDRLGAPKVAIVNQTFARKFGLGHDAVGKRMQIGRGEDLDIEIVGLAADSKYSRVKDVVPATFMLPYRQDERIGSIYFYVRSPLDPDQLLPSIRGALARLDPNLPVEDLQTLATQVRDNVFLDRMLSTLSAAFAVLATLLAAIGLYGVLGYSVAQRRREIGVRMALGADTLRVWGLIFRQVAGIILVGATVGVIGALALGRFARSLLYEIRESDPPTLAAAALVLAAVAFCAGLVPAARAARIDPMRALRED